MLVKKKEEKKKLYVTKLPVYELVIRLSYFFEDADYVREIIKQATVSSWQSDDNQLTITYDSEAGLFWTMYHSGQEKRGRYREICLPYYEPRTGIFKRLHTVSPRCYRFVDKLGGSFTKEELQIIHEAKTTFDRTPEQELMLKMLKEMMIRNIYNYDIV